MEDLSCRDFHIFCHSVIFLMYTDTNFHFSRVIMSQGNDMYRLKLLASICPYVWTALEARSAQGDQGGFRGMISTALFEEAELSERSDRAFSQQWCWLWGLWDDRTLQWRRTGVTGWLQLKHADDERSRVMRALQWFQIVYIVLHPRLLLCHQIKDLV